MLQFRWRCAECQIFSLPVHLPVFSISSPKQPALIGPSIPYSPLHLSLPSLHPASKLQALVYDILPSTTAVFSYAIGSRKLSANEQFFVGSKFVTNNSNKSRPVIYSRQQSLYQHKQNHNRLNRDGTLFFFVFSFLTRGGCVSCLRACLGARLLL